MDDEDRHRADLWSTGVSSRHPIEFVRDQIAERGCVTVAEVLALHKQVARIQVGGVVTHRQRPGTAAGVIFFNLEDETGQLNVVVLPDVWDRYRKVARRAPALIIEGRLEYRSGVTNLVARNMEPLGVQTVRSRDFR